jgi:hypothetical protein
MTDRQIENNEGFIFVINKYKINVRARNTHTHTHTHKHTELDCYLREDNLVIPHENAVDKQYSELKICKSLKFALDLMFV